jgi:gluconokinase
MSLVLSIDIGTTNLKAGVVNQDGKLLLLRKARIPVETPEVGASEHHPDKLFDLMISLSKDVVSKYKNDISVVVLSTYQFGLVLMDQNMKPVSGISLLSDIRARETFEQFKNGNDLEALYRRTGCPPMFQYPLTRLLFFRERRPELFSKARYFLSSKEYLVYRLTGELLGEPSVSSATQMMDIRALDWDPELLSMAGISKEQLAPQSDGLRTLVPLSPSVSNDLGIPVNTQLLMGLYDGGALAVGLSGLEPGVGVMNVGTSAMLRVPGMEPAFDTSGDRRINPYPLGKSMYLNGGALNNAALPLDWLRAKLFDVDLRDFEIVEEGDAHAPLFSIPYLTGERNPKIGPFASGVIFGLRTFHTRNDITRSLLEGVAFSLCMVKDALVENNVEIKEFRMAGGGTAWKVWPQIFADVFNTPMVVPKAQEIALVGSAILGLTALGKFPSIEDAAQSMVNSGERIDPDPKRAERYQEHYSFFRELCFSLVPLFDKHAKLTESARANPAGVKPALTDRLT